MDALLGILLSPSFKFVKDVLFARCWFRVVLKAFLRRVKPWTFEKRHNRHLGRFQILQHIAKFYVSVKTNPTLSKYSFQML